MARKLYLEPNEAQEMKDLASAEAGRIPCDLLSDEQLMPLLPVFFRSFREEGPSRDQLIALAEMIRKENTPQ